MSEPLADPAVELISVHIPKTAGTSFRKMLDQNFPGPALALDYGDRVLDPAALFQTDFARWQSEQAARALPLGTRAVHGHFWLGKYAARFPTARKIVWLRDPVRRLISHYFFWKGLPRSDHSLHQRMLDEQLTLLEFAALPGMRNVLTNIFLRGFGVLDFDFIGLQDFFAEDLAQLARRVGWQNSVAPTVNKTVTGEYAAFDLDAETSRRIALLNEDDMDFYQAVLDRRATQNVA